jgi:hypothetical protein
MAEVCVTRAIFHRNNGNWDEGLITVFMPEPDPEISEHETWACRFRLEWPGFSCENRHRGGDPYQALELALRTLPSIIMGTAEFKSHSLALHHGKVVLDSTSIREFFHARILGDV